MRLLPCPQPYLRPKLAGLLKTSPAELGRLLDSDDQGLKGGGARPDDRTFAMELGSGTLDDMIRREFLRLVSVSGALVGLPQPMPEETGDMDGLQDRRALNSYLWGVYGLTPSKQSVYPAVREQLSSLVDALRHARSVRDHTSLSGMVGDVAQLAGEIWFDANCYTEAAHCYALAADAGRAAGDRDLAACALVRHSFVSLCTGRYDEALPLLDAAASLARNGDTRLPTRYWVASVQAQALAGTGDADGCRYALDEAAQVQLLSGPAPGGWLRFTGERLAEERGSAFVTLGLLDSAEEALTTALAESLSPRRRGSVLADLAVIGARRKDVDRLATYGTQAVELARRTGSGYIARRLLPVKDHLGPFLSDPRVGDMADHIRALGV